MFDISWGEIAILGAVGVAVTGKRDLPNACRFVGHQLGRVVGLMQGARARADRFAHHNELKALQNELRSGLRELDQVKTELAVAASSRGVMGNSLGAMTKSANKIKPNLASTNNNATWKTPQTQLASSLQNHSAVASAPLAKDSSQGKNAMSLSDFDFHVDETPRKESTDSLQDPPHQAVHEAELSPALQSERAVMEEEWTKQGIGFKAQAELGSWNQDTANNDESIVDTTRATGSELLEHLERQCLIFDQYDRVVGEQEREMEQRVERIQNERKKKNEKGDDNGKTQQ